MLENYEELELETMESSSTQSEIGLINAYGITLNSESSVRRLNRKDFSNTWSNVPSEVSDSKVSSLDGIRNLGKSNGDEDIIDANGENSCAIYNGGRSTILFYFIIFKFKDTCLYYVQLIGCIVIESHNGYRCQIKMLF